jgi:nucleotide-binding universal stress UspA family protein
MMRIHYKSELTLIHIGDKTYEKEFQLREILERNGIDNVLVIWKDGQNVVKLILQFCQQYSVDLLIAGALPKDNLLRYYIGSIAREIIRKAGFSVLLLREPSITPTTFKKIAISVEDSNYQPDFLTKAVEIARIQQPQELYLLKESSPSKFAKIKELHSTDFKQKDYTKEFIENEKNLFRNDLNHIDLSNITLQTKILFGKNGAVSSQFASENGVDLLIIPSPTRSYGILDRIFQHGLEYILEDLPCNLLMLQQT